MAHRIVLVCVGLVFGGTLTAQQRPISGKVTGSLDGKPVAGASVAVVGTARLAATNASGEYTVLAPAGPVTLSVRAVGYKRKVVNVAGEQATADVVLEADIFNLDAIVVTGQATGVEQRNLANAVTTVRAEDLNRAPTPTLESALQGRIPGALIQENSGAPGGGVQINLRGVSTINASVDPLIVVDGIIISNDAIGNNLNAITAAAAGGNASNQDNPVNRIADLNPADIDKIEVLKGASAASIYGAQAANGVIIISTRRGQAGAPQFRMTQRLGESHVIHVLKSRVCRDSVEADSVYGTKAQTYCRPTCPDFDNISPLWDRHPLSSETDLSVSGGSDQTRYFVSGLVKRDGGIAPGTGYDKQAARVNFDQQLGSRWTLNFQTQAIHSLSHRGISNNDNSGTSPYLVFPLTPSFVDLRPTGSRISDYPVNPFERSNPLQTYAFLRNDEDVWRILATATLGWQPVATDQQTLRFTLTGGLDNFTQRNDIFSPPELQFEPNDGQPGTVVLGKTQNTNVNLLGNAVYTLTPASRAYRATTSLGVQYFDKSLNFTNLVGRNLPPGQINIDQATSIAVNQDLQPIRDLAIFGQEEVLGLDERLLLTVGARAERTSRNGNVKRLFLYPKAAASYRFTAFGGGAGDELKVRAAWGQTGNQPNFGNKFTPSATGTIGGLFGSSAGFTAGAANIRPERQTELEGGADATLANGRLNVNLTGYTRTVSDLILVQTPAPSSGRAASVFNGGRLRGRGIEMAAGYVVTQTPTVSWLVHATFTKTTSKVLALPVPAFQVGGFGTSLGSFQVEVGKSATQIVGTDSLGNVVRVGDATPDFQLSLANDLTYRRFGLSFLWDWKHGGDVINLTELLFDLFRNSEDWATGGRQRRALFFKGETQPYVQDASYLKLREATLSYHLPPSAVHQMFGDRVRNATVSLSGRNLIRITKFRGIDPEVSNFGNQAIARNIDVAPFPPSRSLFFSIDLDF